MRLATPARYEWEGRGESTVAIVAMGLVLAIAGVVRSLETPVSQPVVAFELFVSLLVPTGLATGGYWLASRDVSPDVRWRALTRVSIGVVVACGLAVWLTGYIALEGGTVRDPLSLATTLSAVGGATGFVSAVRDPLEVESPTAAGTVDATEPPASTDSSDPSDRANAPASAAPDPTMERPTAAAAAAAVPTTAIDEPTADAATTAAGSLPPATEPAPAPSSSPETAASPGAVTTPDGTASATTGSSPAVWQDVDPEGRTAAPASPESPKSPGSPESPESPAELEAVDDSRYVATEPVPARDPGVDAVAAVPSTAEAVLEVLQRERARLALAVLYHEFGDEPRPVDDLARAVADHTDADADAVALGLEHATLPELAAIRAVDWDPYADRVAAADHAVFEEGVREASVLLESFEPGTR